MFANILAKEQQLMKGIQLHKWVGKNNQGRNKKLEKVSQETNSLHRFRIQEQRSFPVDEEEYRISQIWKTTKRKW